MCFSVLKSVYSGNLFNISKTRNAQATFAEKPHLKINSFNKQKLRYQLHS